MKLENTQLREELINQADDAFIVLAAQVNEIFDLAHEYSGIHQSKTMSMDIKMADLRSAISDMAKHIHFIAYLIDGWKNETPRVVSKVGVETAHLNELKVAIEVTAAFFDRESVDLPMTLSMGAVNQAHAELVRCNRIL